MAWFILSNNPDGREGLAGPYTSEYRAQRLIDDCYEVEAKTVYFDTNSLTEASRKRKEQRIKEKGFVEGTRKITHKVGGLVLENDSKRLSRPTEKRHHSSLVSQEL